jgi:hypothetical protein
MSETKLLNLKPPVYDGSGSMTQFLIQVKEYNVYVRFQKLIKILKINIYLIAIESIYLRL